MSRKSTTAKGSRAYTMTRMSYRDIMKLIDKQGMAAFRKAYTAQRDIVHKQLMRLSKSTGTKGTLAKEALSGRGGIMKLSEIDKMVKAQSLTPTQAAKLYASALSNINTLYFSKRHSIRGWKETTQKIKQSLEAAGYQGVTGAHLDMMGELMARVVAIYGRKHAPSEEVLEAILDGFGDEMKKMTDEQLAVFLSKWDERDNLELYS